MPRPARILGALLALTLAVPAAGARAADDKDAKPILDRAVEALGGEAALKKAAASATWKTKGKVVMNGDTNDFSTQATAKGVDHLRDEFTGEFGGNEVRGVRVLAGKKGWMSFNDNTMEFDADAVGREAHNHFQELAPILVLPLMDAGVKVEAAGTEDVDGKPADKVKVTAPDKTTFTLSFDKATGLPAKLSGTAYGWQGEEYAREAKFSDYREMGGIKKATKVVTTRDGEKFLDVTITEFKPVDKVADSTFDEPK